MEKLETEVLQASKDAMEDAQKDLKWSNRQQERAREILKGWLI